MPKKPWTIGEQQITVLNPPREDTDERGLGTSLEFSTDPGDASTKRLRIVALDGPDVPAIEMVFQGGGELLGVHYQPRHLKPWQRLTDKEIAEAAEAKRRETVAAETKAAETEAVGTKAAEAETDRLAQEVEASNAAALARRKKA